MTVFILLLIFCISCSNEKQLSINESSGKKTEQSLVISAAISLTDALEDIKDIYEKEHDVELTFNFGGSGTLTQQIQQGAPVDLFISANEDWMDQLEEKDLLVNHTRTNITANRLVAIANEKSSLQEQPIDELLTENIDKIAIGNPETVPAGKYAKQSLNHLNVWSDLNPDLIFAKDVRQVLTYVETGNADIGFVYESDALMSSQIKILTTIDQKTHDSITYPGAILTEANNFDEAEQFLKFLKSDTAQKIFEHYGFTK